MGKKELNFNFKIMINTLNKIANIFFFCLITFVGYTQDNEAINTSNYIDYYQLINEAEIQYFIKGNEKEALKTFDKVFEAYDFIFLTDIMEVAQIAKFENKPYRKYLEMGFKFGLKLKHLENYPLFKNDLPGLLKDKELEADYVKSRKLYLSKINFDYLKWTYEVYLKDQKDKSIYNNYADYLELLDRGLNQVKSKIEKNGFPGEKVIGVPDSIIFKEKGIWQLDLKEKAKRAKYDYRYKINTHDADLSPALIIVYLIHHQCAFQKLEDVLIEEMKRGNIHPRSVAVLSDNDRTFRKSPSKQKGCRDKSQEAFFRISEFTEYPELTDENRKSTNQLRKKFYVNSLEVDIEKLKFQKNNDFVLFTRFWDYPRF